MMSPSSAVRGQRVGPDEVAPTARTFFPIPGTFIVHVVRPESVGSPSLPAAKMRRCSGFYSNQCEGTAAAGGENRDDKAVLLSIESVGPFGFILSSAGRQM